MESPTPNTTTLELAAQDVRQVLERQKDERQILLTQLNILFVTREIGIIPNNRLKSYLSSVSLAHGIRFNSAFEGLALNWVKVSSL